MRTIQTTTWFLTVLLIATPLLAQPLTPEEARGRQIFLQGTSPSGEEILARMQGGVEVPAAALPCASCHGRDGRGNPEGGVSPSDLTWESLTRPYAVRTPGGREHPPYDERLLTRAVTMGIDPGGNELHVAMPRYGLRRDDMAALAAYLKRLTDVEDPGVDEETLRLGTMLPLSGRFGDMGRAMRSALEAYLAEINEQGGIYGRRLELRVVDAPAGASEREERLSRFLDEEEIFALVGSFIAGADDEITSLLDGRGIPLVGPFTLRPETGWPLNRYVFYLFSGVREEGRALVSFASQSREDREVRTSVVHPDDERLAAAADAVVREAEDLGWTDVERFSYARASYAPEDVVRGLRESGTGAVVFLGSAAELETLLKSAAEADWSFDLLAPGSVSGPAVLSAAGSFPGEIFLSYPTLPVDQTPDGAKEYRELAAKHGLPESYLVSQLATLSAAKVLVEGLKLTGREATREKLTTALEGLDAFRTEITPPITYNANRRLGAQGAWVVAVNGSGERAQGAAGWVEVD